MGRCVQSVLYQRLLGVPDGFCLCFLRKTEQLSLRGQAGKAGCQIADVQAGYIQFLQALDDKTIALIDQRKLIAWILDLDGVDVIDR